MTIIDVSDQWNTLEEKFIADIASGTTEPRCIGNHLRRLMTLFNSNLIEKDVETNPDTLHQYIPISKIEMYLDTFFPMWNTQNMKMQVFDMFADGVPYKKVVGSIEITMQDPISGYAFTRTGSAGISVRAKKFEFEGKTLYYTVEGVPGHLKSEMIKNACKSLGKMWGGELNRAINDVAPPIDETFLNVAMTSELYNKAKARIDEMTKEELDKGRTKMVEDLKTMGMRSDELVQLNDYIKNKMTQSDE